MVWVLGWTALLLAGVLAGLWWRERRARQAAERQLEELELLVRQRLERPDVFGHEVRTPLALISGAAELLAEESPGPLNALQREFVQTIATNARQVVGMAEDLLVEARLASQLFEPHRVPVDLRVLVREAVREVRRINTTRIDLVSQGTPLVVDVDPDLMRQALWNLVNNAVRHAGPEVCVTVELTRGEGEAVVQVCDDGEGMSATEREQLFEAYVVGSSRRPGTGLGMMITQQIVGLHQGRILVDSAPGQGTAIFLALPLHEVEEDSDGR
ncbi:HAMP domain-containing sensor histidine kinase [Luteococcus peritonei]|uniref:histidine kinase n=1 Tax=Luteococcus peritonei TaxID=88874 RepID=A0ABW4RUI4_9ACTN